MKIQIKSDLHWENEAHKTRLLISGQKDSSYVSPDAEVLVLAGDIVNANEYQLNYLLYKFKDIKIPIFYVPGNHEYWGSSFLDARNLLRKKLSGTNITLLDKSSSLIKKGDEEVLFIGATLWTNLTNPNKSLIASQTKDFKEIRGMTTDLWSKTHFEEITYIEKTLSYGGYRYMKKVVLSHYLPSMKSVPERFKGNELNCIFVAEDMERVILEHAPELYIHGHTHDSNDYKMGDTRVISNPKGAQYMDFNGLNPTYNNELVIEI